MNWIFIVGDTFYIKNTKADSKSSSADPKYPHKELCSKSCYHPLLHEILDFNVYGHLISREV